MGGQRNNPQMKGKEEASERTLNEIETSQLSDIEFKALVIRKLNELTENYQKLQRNCKELTAKQYQHEKRNRNYQQGPRGTKSRLDEAEDGISELEKKVEKKHP